MTKKYLFPPIPEFTPIIWPEGFYEKQKAYFTCVQKSHEEEKQRLCLGYQCECGSQDFFVIDRVPMSEKIGYTCKTCNKFDFRPICDPLVFWNEDIGYIDSDELQEVEILDRNHYQVPYLMQFIR